MVEEFEHWLKANEERLGEKGYEIRFVRSEEPSNRNTAYVVPDSEKHGASVAVRCDGSFDLEVLDYGSGDLVLGEHRIFDDAENLLSALDDAREYLVSLSEVGP